MVRNEGSGVVRAAGYRRSIILRYLCDVRRYFTRRLHSACDVEDLTQEVCLRFLSCAEVANLEQPLAYLYRIAAHALADFRRKAAREAEGLTIDSDVADTWLERGSGAVRPICLERLGLEQEIAFALSKLSATHRSVLLAHKRDGLSYKETAERLKLSIHTVEKYVAQAKAHIRKVRRG